MRFRPAHPKYIVRLLRREPETRWFQRHVLRRRSRYVTMFAGQPDSFTLERSINNVANLVTVVNPQPWP